MLVDFHNHILPAVDDGSKSLDMSLAMLKEAQRQGITDVVNTIHFQHPKMDKKNVEYSYILNIMNNLQEEVYKNDIIIKIHLTSEVYYLPNLVEVSRNKLTTFGKNKYMLIEFPINLYPTGYENEIYELQLKGISPIIAHPERYRFVNNDYKIFQKWIDKGYIIQIDGGSVLGHFGKSVKKTANYMLRNGYVHLIGSDAHNHLKRNFCLLDAYNYVGKKISKELVETLKLNAINLLNGEALFICDSFKNRKKYNFLDTINNILKI